VGLFFFEFPEQFVWFPISSLYRHSAYQWGRAAMFRRDGTYRNPGLGSVVSGCASAFGSIDKLDYSIRRWAIPDHPSKTTQSSRRTDAPLNELQRAIGRYLAAEYELVLPIPDRLVALLRKIERPARSFPRGMSKVPLRWVLMSGCRR
jgi:hypothetical protein